MFVDLFQTSVVRFQTFVVKSELLALVPQPCTVFGALLIRDRRILVQPAVFLAELAHLLFQPAMFSGEVIMRLGVTAISHVWINATGQPTLSPVAPPASAQ